MSRIAKYPVPVPKGVDVTLAGGNISVKGPLGVIARAADPNVTVEKDGENIVFKMIGDSNHANAMSGTMRASFCSTATRTLTVALPRSAVGMIAITWPGKLGIMT